MLKKGFVLGAAALLLLGLLFGREGFSHVKTSLGWVQQSVRESVPVDFEISRARQMIKDLDPEIHRNMHLDHLPRPANLEIDRHAFAN